MKVINLQCGYKNQIVIREVNYEFKKSKVYGIVGHNGAGKTTFLRTILGIVNKKSGELINDSNDNICYIPEKQGLYKELTVVENIKISHGLIDYCADEKIGHLLDKWKLSGYSEKRAKELSTGLQTRLKFLCAFPEHADLIICDEPTLGVDARTQQMIADELMYCRNRGATVIVTSHNLNFIKDICDEILIFNNHEVVYCGEVETIKDFESVYLQHTEEDDEKCSLHTCV